MQTGELGVGDATAGKTTVAQEASAGSGPMPGPVAPRPAPQPVGRAEPREAGPKLAVDAWEALFRAQVAIMRRLAHDDIWGEVSVREYDVLLQLARSADHTLRLRDLNERLLLSQPSVSRLVERLEARGLVVRAPVPDDARGVSVRLTEAGARVQGEVGRQHARTIARLVGGALGEEELRALLGLCRRLAAAQLDIPDPSETKAGEQR